MMPGAVRVLDRRCVCVISEACKSGKCSSFCEQLRVMGFQTTSPLIKAETVNEFVEREQQAIIKGWSRIMSTTLAMRQRNLHDSS